MKIFIFFCAAICSYLFCALNPAIVLSTLVYKEDIREKGSKNPGFTNFKRTYGMKLAWLVLLLDISKALIVEVIFGFAFAAILGDRALGVAFSGIFAFLGHSFPCWYKFKGGKGFSVLMGTIFILNWKAGLIALAVLCIFLFTIRYMSLATMVCLTAAAGSLFFFAKESLIANIIYSVCVLLMIIRHHENIKRIFSGTEKKFSFSSKKEKALNSTAENSEKSQQSDDSAENKL